MKLSDLVRYLSNLETQGELDAEHICRQHMGDQLRMVDQSQPFLQTHSEMLHRFYDQTRRDLVDFQQALDQTKQELRDQIASMQPSYFAESYRLHDQEMVNDSDEHILNRVTVLPDTVKNYIEGRIMMSTDWHHAAMVIRPGQGQWLRTMVSCDPLYILDIRESLLSAATEQFNPDYRRRLRRYVLRENDRDGRVLRDLPDAQFGFCLALDFFHFKPFELIKCYLTDIYHKLKPGGVLALTFNDCDHPGGVELAERSWMCYTPGGMLKTLAVSLGFEIRQTYQIANSNTWLELKRPGVLTSNRGGQSLAKIIAK